MKTQAQSQLGREGTAQSTWLRRARICRPSSPFSLSTRPSHAEEPTNNETHPHTAKNKTRVANSAAATQWQNQLHKKISKELQLNQEADKITSLRLKADRLKQLRKQLQKHQFD